MASNPFEFAGAWRRTEKGNVDQYYGGGESAWVDRASALAGVPLAIREGKKVGIWESGKVVEYAWGTDTSDAGLLKFAIDTTDKFTKTGDDLTGPILIEEPTGAGPSNGMIVWGYKFFDIVQIVSDHLSRIFQAKESTDNFIFEWITGVYSETRKRVLTIGYNDVEINANVKILGALTDGDGNPIVGDSTVVDDAVADGNLHAVTSNAVFDALTNKSNTGHTHLATEVSGLATVATSGSYNDLSNKPSIPAAYTDEQAQDAFAAALAAGTHTNITVTYDDANNKISLSGSGGSSSDASTTVKGIAKLSVAPVSATDPIAVGNNDPRLSDFRTPLDGSVTVSKLDTSLQNKTTAGNTDYIPITLTPDMYTSGSGWITYKGKISSITIDIISKGNDTDYSPSTTYSYTFESRATTLGTVTTRTGSTTAVTQFSGDMVTLNSSSTSKSQFRITMPTNVPVEIEAILTITKY